MDIESMQNILYVYTPIPFCRLRQCVLGGVPLCFPIARLLIAYNTLSVACFTILPTYSLPLPIYRVIVLCRFIGSTSPTFQSHRDIVLPYKGCRLLLLVPVS